MIDTRRKWWYKRLKDAVKDICKKDGNTWCSNSKLKVLATALSGKCFQFYKWTPCARLKKDGGHRIIIVPPLVDRIVLRTLATHLSTVLKASFSKVSDVSFAYQKGKGVREALLRLKSLYTSGNVILKVDIRKFFDNIDKDIVANLLDGYKIDKYVRTLMAESFLPKLKSNEYYDEAISQIQHGIPQGNAISAVISNLMLLELDMQSKSKNLKMIRYADDMVFICDGENQAHSTLEWLTGYLEKERKLTVHPLSSGKDAKTLIISDLKKTRLVYLGVEFDGERLLPTKQCLAIFISKIHSIVQSANLSIGQRIKDINTCITQWCGYYAFTDITDNRLISLSKQINRMCSKAFDKDWTSIDLVKNIGKYRNKQHNRIHRMVSPIRFGEDYKWLMIYN